MAETCKHPINIDTRSAGVLLHISSLPTGDLGRDAYRFVDFLAATGICVWQTLPINMPHTDNSPYQCLSAHAGNPAFISLDKLVEQGLISPTQSHECRITVFKVAYETAKKSAIYDDFIRFCQQHSAWLDDFSLYLLLRDQRHHQGWFDWPKQFKNRSPQALEKLANQYAEEINLIQFTQYLFFSQWIALKAYANSKQVQLFGDIPIFVAYDSADVWANPQLFKLDENMHMTVVAGVPPDYFSATGQRWGNPHYQWDVMAKDDYAWWVERLHTQAELFDLIRIDHFRGLEAAWEIPAHEDTAIGGTWAVAPGDALLASIYRQLPGIHLVAEDLGIITPEVDALRLKYALPGMKILQFAFGGDEHNPYLPEQIELNSVVYTGTHDNDTTLGWYRLAEAHVIEHLHRYLQNTEPVMPKALIELVMHSKGYLAIIPMQDVLGLGSDCRMNTPGTVIDNWNWRFAWPQLSWEHQQALKEVVEAAGRSHG
jgi:4-alpha-glucanotransferase